MKTVEKTIKEYLLCFAGALFVAVGVYFFKFPNNFSTGGVSGISMVIGNCFAFVSASEVASALNALLLIIGFVFVGRDCGIKTVIGTITLSGALVVFERLFPMTAPFTDEPLLELAFAVFLPALGSAILFNVGGSTGGTDIVAMILKKHTSLNIGTALFISDIAITLLAFIFGPEAGLFSVLGLFIKTFAVDSLIENFNACKCFTIITDYPDEISGFITQKLGRSCTVVEGVGGFTNSRKYVLTAVMKRHQAKQLRDYLRDAHPDTFMTITDSSEVIGKGFRGF